MKLKDILNETSPKENLVIENLMVLFKEKEDFEDKIKKCKDEIQFASTRSSYLSKDKSVKSSATKAINALDDLVKVVKSVKV